MPNTEYNFKANVLSNKTAENHLSDFTEGDILFIKDKGVPIPADKVGTADSEDKGKVPVVNADGGYEFAVIPRYTVTAASSSTATLALNDTTVLPGTPTAVSVTLPTPVSGNDYLVGLIFKAGASMTFSDTAPTGYAIKWDSNPTWTEGKVYEIIYRCLWLTDANGNVIISAKWSEV